MEFSEFLKENALLISAIIAAIILLLIIFFLVAPRLNKQKKTEVIEDKSDLFTTALGSEENITELQVRGSRITVTLKDRTKVDQEKLKNSGVSRIIIMENKIVLLVEESVIKNLNKLR